MLHPNIIAECVATPWALEPRVFAQFQAVLARLAAGRALDPAVASQVAADREARDARRSASVNAGGGAIAVLPFYGVVTQRGNMMDDLSGPGSCSTQKFAATLREALADPQVGGILIDVSSPGGSVYGVQELAAEIYAARGKKPIYAIANSLAASAAYWAGCAAEKFFCTPSGEVGSIGVYQMHQDVSKMLEEEGVAIEFISAGKYKVEGHPYGPLGDEARAFLQQRVDEYYVAFSRNVAKYRGVGIDQVRNGMGQGRCLGAAEAKTEGMIDDVMNFDEALAELARAIHGNGGNARAGVTLPPTQISDAADGASAEVPEADPASRIDESKAARRAARERALEILSC